MSTARNHLPTRTLLGALLGLGLLATGGCVDEEIVFRDRELFEEPATAALGMLGYSNLETGLTVCGNCHIGPQGEWEETNHSSAWETLEASGSSQQFCESCHTTNELGNVLTEAAGYNAVPEERYHDVTCESCHGPGLTHVQNPSDATVPLAPMDVGLDNTQGCGECHQGTHHPFTDQWETSGHANVGFQASRSGCRDCHSGNGALDAWGVNTTYLEEGENIAITCATCHDPHGSDNPAQLRFPIGGVEIANNLCSQCHNKRDIPENNSHGLHPHSPETGLLEGDFGWFPPGLVVDRGEIIATHGSEANENLCATCHVSSTTVTDAATGEFQFAAVGHGFNAIPCLDAEGIPTTEDCDLTQDGRDYTGCLECHDSVNGVYAALTTSATRLQNLTEELEELLALVDPNGEAAGGEIDAADGRFTLAEGAFFNAEIAKFGGTDRPDARLAYTAAATHNPFLTEQLLIASINAVEDQYSVSASADLVRERLLKPGH